MSRRTAVKPEDSDQEMDEHSSDNEDTDTSSASDDDSSSGKYDLHSFLSDESETTPQ